MSNLAPTRARSRTTARSTRPTVPASDRYAALYIRVSTEKQRDNWSVKDQLGLAKLGEERGLPVEIYDEQGASGETIDASAVSSFETNSLEPSGVTSNASGSCPPGSTFIRRRSFKSTTPIPSAARSGGGKELSSTPGGALGEPLSAT